MAREQIIVAVEIGTFKSAVVVGEVSPDGSMRLLGISQQPSRGVRKGEIVDAETAFKCVSDALNDAERKTDTQISNVILGVTGSHLRGFTHRLTLELERPEEIQPEVLDDMLLRAERESETADRYVLLASPQRYILDGGQEVLNPSGLVGRRLDADYHCISVDQTRALNSVNILKKAGLSIDQLVAASYAAALAATTDEERARGVLVIDMGGGTTDYIAHVDGVIRHSGSLAVGGDHVSNDISLGLRLPMNLAQKLMVEEASLDSSTAMPGDTLSIKGDAAFAGRDVSRQDLNTIVSLRIQETLQHIRNRIQADDLHGFLSAGAVITGGCAKLSGLAPFAEEVLGLPVRIGRPQLNGVPGGLNDPSLIVPIGIARAGADILLSNPDPSPIETIKNLFGNLFGRRQALF